MKQGERDSVFGSARYLVWRYIADHPGCTDSEVREALSLNKNTARPRRIELEHAGLVEMVFPPARDEKGNISERWIVTGKPYPNTWAAPTAADGTALIVRSIQRICKWAIYVSDPELLSAAEFLKNKILRLTSGDE